MVGDGRAAPQSMIYSTVDTVLYTRDTRSHGDERGPHPNLPPAAPPPGAPSRSSRTRRVDGPAAARGRRGGAARSEEHTSELQSLAYLVCRLLLEKKKKRLHTSAHSTKIVVQPSPP